MRFIKPYQEFNINEKENTSYSPLSAYRAVALGVNRAFNLLGYFYSIANKDIKKDEWKNLTSSILSTKNYEAKWDAVIKSAKDIQSNIEKYASGRRDDGLNVGRFFDVGVNSRSIPIALEKFRSASNLLTNNLSPNQIRERLSLLDQAIPMNPYKLDESLINEGAGKKRAPGESEVLLVADNLSSSVTNALSTARNLKQLFPDAVQFIDNVVSKYISPAAEKVKEVIETEAPDASLEISKSIRNSYKRDGWLINNVQEKYLVDQYRDLLDLQDSVKTGLEKIRKAKENIIDELAPSSDAGEFVDAGNRILDLIEDKIAEKDKVEELRRRAGLMIPIAQDEPLPSTASTTTTTSGPRSLVDPNELRDLLQRKISRNR